MSRYLHLADSDHYIAHGQSGHDPMYKVWPLIDQALAACHAYYSPGVAVSMNEAMIPFQGRLHFKQYIQNKPNPWGVKVWCCCDPRNGYMLDFKFYTGKSEAPIKKGIGHSVVMKQGTRFLDKYHHFYYDNCFSSVRLAKDLLDRLTYSCAPIHQNCKLWPMDLKGKLAKSECHFRQIGNLVAYHWHDKRPISFICTNSNPDMGTAMRRTKVGPMEKQIPTHILNYNANMGGVNLTDQLRTYYPNGRKGYKWWRCCFLYLLELSILNSFLLYQSMPRPRGSKPKTQLGGSDHSPVLLTMDLEWKQKDEKTFPRWNHKKAN